MQLPPRVSVAYELDRARAGNRLFCPLSHPARTSGDPVLPYEHAARLLRLLTALGLASPDINASLTLIAGVLDTSARSYAGRVHVADYLLYRLRGIPHAASPIDKTLHAVIATFYAAWLSGRIVSGLKSTQSAK